MIGLLALAFLVVPILEIYVITQVAEGLGWGTTLALVVLVSLVGAVLVKVQGLHVLARTQRRLLLGQVPGREILDGALILVAGALLLTPGFVTAAIGLVLLFPPTRAVVRAWLGRRFRHRVTVGGISPDPRSGGGLGGRFARWADVVDTDEASPRGGGATSSRPRVDGADGPDALGRGAR